MATFTKTIQTALLAIQSVAASSVVISSAFDVSAKLGAMVHVRFGRRIATAAGAGANIRIESSSASSGDNSWFPLAQFTTNFALCEGEVVAGTVGAGVNAIAVASTANLTPGDVIFIDNPTIANSEWGRIKSITANVLITLEDNLVNAQTGSTIYDSAEIYAPVAIPQECVRIRVVDDGSLFTQAHAIHAALITLDSIA